MYDKGSANQADIISGAVPFFYFTFLGKKETTTEIMSTCDEVDFEAIFSLPIS